MSWQVKNGNSMAPGPVLLRTTSRPSDKRPSRKLLSRVYSSNWPVFNDDTSGFKGTDFGGSYHQSDENRKPRKWGTSSAPDECTESVRSIDGVDSNSCSEWCNNQGFHSLVDKFQEACLKNETQMIDCCKDKTESEFQENQHLERNQTGVLKMDQSGKPVCRK